MIMIIFFMWFVLCSILLILLLILLREIRKQKLKEIRILITNKSLETRLSDIIIKDKLKEPKIVVKIDKIMKSGNDRIIDKGVNVMNDKEKLLYKKLMIWMLVVGITLFVIGVPLQSVFMVCIKYEYYSICSPSPFILFMFFAGSFLTVNSLAIWCEVISKKQKIHKIIIFMLWSKPVFGMLFIGGGFGLVSIIQSFSMYFPLEMVTILVIGKIRNTIIGFDNHEIREGKIRKHEKALKKLRSKDI